MPFQNSIEFLNRKKQREIFRRRLAHEPLETRIVLDSTVVFSELMYNPGLNQDLEWIELHNEMAVDMDISRWRIDGVGYEFPIGTIVEAGDYVVIAKDPEKLAATGVQQETLGPYFGQLSNAGETIRLINNSNRTMDEVDFSDDQPWPVAADGSGVSLAKVHPDGGSAHVKNWSFSDRIGGTPGSANFDDGIRLGERTALIETDHEWRYFDADASPGETWNQPQFNPDDPNQDGDLSDAWKTGRGILGNAGVDFALPITTTINANSHTHFFRTEFHFDGQPDSTSLRLDSIVDDGAVIYLNGTELSRLNMPSGPISIDTPAESFIGNALYSGEVALPSNLLVNGTNVLAVELHQAVPRNPDAADPLPGSVMRITSPEGYEVSWTGTDGEHFDEAAPTNGSVVPINRALASQGAVAFASSDLGPEIGTTYHITENLNDGFYGNANSWIGGDNNPHSPIQFAGIRFPEPILVNSVAWGRDNGNDVSDACGGQCTDRVTGTYNLQFTTIDNAGPDTQETADPRTGWASMAFVTYRSNQDEVPGRGFTNYLRHEYLTRFLGEPVEATAIRIIVPRTGLSRGTAIDEIEVYAAESTETPDVVFAANLSAAEIIDNSNQVRFSEIGPGSPGDLFIELENRSSEPLDLTGYKIDVFIPVVAPFQFAGQVIPANGFLSLEWRELGFGVSEGVPVFLISPDGQRVLDAVRTSDRVQGRSPEHKDRWLAPTIATPGSANTFAFESNIVINEIMYHGPYSAEHTDLADEEWIEIFNRSETESIDLSGWTFTEAVRFEFEEGTSIGPSEYRVVANDARTLRTKYPKVAPQIVGEFSGSLANSTDSIRLNDGNGNPADEVTYFDAGRWPKFADGGSASLELIDPQADNNVAESWAASEESSKAIWETVRYQGEVVRDGFTNSVTRRYNELILGLLNDGEVLIDDISVIEDPSGAAIQRVQNGSFEDDAIGQPPEKWRINGNHFGTVVVDPNDSSNQVLHMTTTGAMEDRYNHAETTFVDNADIDYGATYEISFRAKWVAGSNQLNSHLYFDRLSTTTLLSRPINVGTPGEANSRAVENIGPSFYEFSHRPIVPDVGEPVSVVVSVADPQGVVDAQLWYSVDSGPFASLTMTGDANGMYAASIPGQSAGDVVQFYVEAVDSLGQVSFFPAGGASSRALFKVQDDQAREGIHNFQIVMTPDDTQLLHSRTNVMSNGRLGATVVYNENEAFYDAGVRLKGSNAGRGNAPYLGFNIAFDPTHLFRGVHDSVVIDRSGRSSSTPLTQDEILIKHVGNHAGDIPLMYDDLVHVIAPQRRHSRTAALLMARYGDVFLDSQFENGSDGTVFKLDIAYVPNGTTNRDPEGPKLAFPYSHPQPTKDLRDYGDDKELYRSHLLIRNNRDRDDYTRIIDAAKAISVGRSQIVESTKDVIDADQWARTFALQSLTGAADAYTRGSLHHNIEFYVRPSDNRVLAFPWDWDFAFTASTRQSLIGTAGTGGRLMNSPGVRRLYHGHLLDIINTTFNNEYMDDWIDHYGDVAGQNLGPIKSYIGQRSSYVLGRLPDEFPFEITTNEGNNIQTDSQTITLQGKGWINVREITSSNSSENTSIRWLNDTDWEITLPLLSGSNEIELTAFDHQGQTVGTDSIVVTTSTDNRVSESLRISEINFNPSNPTPSELAIRDGLENDDFEFIELVNVGDSPINLANVEFSDGIEFRFPQYELAAGMAAVVVRDMNAFSLRYGAEIPVIGQFESGRLANGGERISLNDPFGSQILELTYDDDELWPQSADGVGATLVLRDPLGTSAERFDKWYSWRGSKSTGGSPGVAENATGSVVINEVLTFSQLDGREAIELFNPTDSAIDVGGWFLSDDSTNLLKRAIPQNTIVRPGEYVVLETSRLIPDPRPGIHFGDGEPIEVWLSQADGNGGVESLIDHVFYDESNIVGSFARWPNATGRIQFNHQHSLGRENQIPSLSRDTVFTEIHYHPAEPSAETKAFWPSISPDDLEFVRVGQVSDFIQSLTGWKISGGIEFEITQPDFFEQDFIVVSFDPDLPANAGRLNAFRNEYPEIDRWTKIVGPYSGRLSDDGELLRLLRTESFGDPNSDLVVGDELVYDNISPWPTQAAGEGHSLKRKLPFRSVFGPEPGFGDDPANWTSGIPVVKIPFATPDLNNDGALNALDIDLMAAAVIQEMSQGFDLDGDGQSDAADYLYLIENILQTNYGDANLDGVFNSADLVTVFQRGKFEDGIDQNAGWEDGDWNGDGDFTTSDFVVAFGTGGYVFGGERIPTKLIDSVFEEEGLNDRASLGR